MNALPFNNSVKLFSYYRCNYTIFYLSEAGDTFLKYLSVFDIISLKPDLCQQGNIGLAATS